MPATLTKAEAGQNYCPCCGRWLPKVLAHKPTEWVDAQQLDKYLRKYYERGYRYATINGVRTKRKERNTESFYKLRYQRFCRVETAERLLAHFDLDPHYVNEILVQD